MNFLLYFSCPLNVQWKKYLNAFFLCCLLYVIRESSLMLKFPWWCAFKCFLLNHPAQRDCFGYYIYLSLNHHGIKILRSWPGLTVLRGMCHRYFKLEPMVSMVLHVFYVLRNWGIPSSTESIQTTYVYLQSQEVSGTYRHLTGQLLLDNNLR